jgi:bacterioferritin
MPGPRADRRRALRIFERERKRHMKGNDAIITTLNAALADELTAISQYMVHSEMCANWGYGKLHEAVEKRAMKEMEHAETLIARIIFFEGKPIVSKLKEMHIGPDVKAQLESDLAAELGAVAFYNQAVRQAADLGDNGTRELFEGLLTDEEDHVDWIEAQLDQIAQMGVPNYLLGQVG